MLSGDSIFGLFLVAGLAGGFGHCSGMCGPLVILVAPGRPRLGKALILHLGRVLSYTLIGGSLAAISSLVGAEIFPASAQKIGLAVVGTLLVLTGLATLGLPWLRLRILEPRPGNRITAIFSRVARLPGASGSFALGLLWGFIPCGLLYTAFAAALGAGTEAANPAIAWLRGALVLLLFGIGTTPTLVGIGLAAASLPHRARIVLQRVAAVVVAATGVILLARAIGV